MGNGELDWPPVRDQRDAKSSRGPLVGDLPLTITELRFLPSDAPGSTNAIGRIYGGNPLGRIVAISEMGSVRVDP